MKIIKYFCFATLCLVSCSLDNNEVIQTKWQYDSGFKLKYNSFAFGAGVFKLQNDTIFLVDSAIAVIVGRDKGFVFKSNTIKIRSIQTGEISIYRSAGEVKKEDTTYTLEVKQLDLVSPPIPPDPPRPK